jgi:chromosome segregation ATPase
MTEEEPAPSRPQRPPVLAFVALALLGFGVGMLLESQLAARTAAEAKAEHDKEMSAAADQAQQALRKASDEKQQISETLDKERTEHEHTVQTKDRSLAAAAQHASGVRHALEAELSAARTSGDACTSRITRISEAIGGIFDSVGEVAGFAQDLERENGQLKADNQSLSEKLAGWQKWNTERMNRIVITAPKG